MINTGSIFIAAILLIILGAIAMSFESEKNLAVKVVAYIVVAIAFMGVVLINVYFIVGAGK